MHDDRMHDMRGGVLSFRIHLLAMRGKRRRELPDNSPVPGGLDIAFMQYL